MSNCTNPLGKPVRILDMNDQASAPPCDQAQPMISWLAARRQATAWSSTATSDLVVDLSLTVGRGKGVRSALFQRCYRTMGGNDEEIERRCSAALELLHESFLLHDDVIDGDTRRRGTDNVIGRTIRRSQATGAAASNAGHLGRTAGILGGDLLLTGALLEFARVSLGVEQRNELLDVVEETILDTIAGEVDDVALCGADESLTMTQALRVSAQKTAAYTVELPLAVAAISAGADSETVNTLREIGRDLGTAFQVVDDILGIFGDPATTGKSADADLLARKPTSLLAFAARTEQWAEIKSLLAPPGFGSEGDVNGRSDSARSEDFDNCDRVRELMEDCGARHCAETIVADLLERTERTLQSSNVAPPLREELQSMATQMVVRTR